MHTFATTAAAVLVVLLGGCGSQEGDGPGTGDPASTSNPEAEPEGRLMISVRPAPGQPTKEWTLTCDPHGGDHPRPADACRALTTAPQDPFAPVPADTMCTQQYGGPQTATVKGTWHGESVDATYQRTDGCEIHRWDTIAAALEPGGT